MSAVSDEIIMGVAFRSGMASAEGNSFRKGPAVTTLVLLLLSAFWTGAALAEPCQPSGTERKTSAADGHADAFFGAAVAISGEYAIIGAPFDFNGNEERGAAYIFQRTGDGGSFDAGLKVTASDGSDGDIFGNAVSIAENYAIVGALGDDDHGSASGAVYIFERNGADWGQAAKLTAPDGGVSNQLGWSVAISGDHAIAGAPGDNDKGINSGSAYIFQRADEIWDQTGPAKLVADDGAMEMTDSGTRSRYSAIRLSLEHIKTIITVFVRVPCIFSITTAARGLKPPRLHPWTRMRTTFSATRSRYPQTI